MVSRSALTPQEPFTGRIDQPPSSHQTFQGPRTRCDVWHVSSAELTKFAKKLDDGKYAYSWYENAQEGAGAEEVAVDGEGDASGAGLTSHF